ncbi:NAD(P) transhydrogenase alpha subunit [hydrothermal vent metagenome]|uniref:proton-translocating NAD(P)(+) transhydrogenase n=1 Tax=hydrothermal vent metagenome TaxID=652676 RepID=A0A3B1D9R1_9ZZZZ
MDTPSTESSPTYELNRPAPVQPLTIGVPCETFSGESRVSLVPATVFLLKKKGLNVVVQSGAGEAAGFPDEQYQKEGAEIKEKRADVFSQADVILQVRAMGNNKDAGKSDLGLLREGQTIIAMCDPLSEPEILRDIASEKVTVIALELLPRITRAQSMDVLSSMATIAGYKAVLLAANITPRMFPMMMTAAGTVKPAKVFIMGAGVAGLQAIATAKRLGAIVKAYDVRSVVKEQIESLGGKFVEVNLDTNSSESSGGYAKEMGPEFLKKQQEVMTEVVAESDVVITTAAIPGKKSPILVTAEMAKGMKPGSVIIDLAAERGGNCELTKLNETVVEQGITILGPGNIPSMVPFHASEMFARNITTLLLHLVKDGKLNLDTEDEIIRDTLVTHQGKLVNTRIREMLNMEPLGPATPYKKTE